MSPARALRPLPHRLGRRALGMQSPEHPPAPAPACAAAVGSPSPAAGTRISSAAGLPSWETAWISKALERPVPPRRPRPTQRGGSTPSPAALPSASARPGRGEDTWGDAEPPLLLRKALHARSALQRFYRHSVDVRFNNIFHLKPLKPSCPGAPTQSALCLTCCWLICPEGAVQDGAAAWGAGGEAVSLPPRSACGTGQVSCSRRGGWGCSGSCRIIPSHCNYF